MMNSTWRPWRALFLAGMLLLFSGSLLAGQVSDLQQQLDSLKQQVTQTQDDKALAQFSDDSQRIMTEAQDAQLQLHDTLGPVITQLNVLGPVQNAGMANETPEVTARRQKLSGQRAELEKNISQLQAIEKNAQLLMAQIVSLRRDILKVQLTLRQGSIFSLSFWRPMFLPDDWDTRQVGSFWLSFLSASGKAFSGPWWVGSLFNLLVVLILPFVYQRLVKVITVGTPKLIRRGRLIRSFYATMVVLLTISMVGGMGWLASSTFMRLPDISSPLNQFLAEWLRMCLFMALWLGVCNALLSTAKPSWRLVALDDWAADTLRPFPAVIAGIVFLSSTFELSNRSAGVSVPVNVASSAVSVLLLLACTWGMTWRISRAARQNSENKRLPPQTVLPHLIILLFCIVVFGSLVLGYIAFARYLMYKFLWGMLVVSCAFLMVRLWEDVCCAVFSAEQRIGNSLKALCKFEDRHLAMVAVVFSGGGRVALILIALVLVMNGTFDSTSTDDLLKKIADLWSGTGLERINIVPAHIVNAVMVLLIGGFLLLRARRWLEDKFFPHTLVDKGMQVSLVALFSNIGYATIIMFTFSSLGVTWDSLAWIVSALSVGIGFGLQEIVKNFISGLILLTERPVRVGDLVSISGVEGDIKRINVRATEILLSDRSTVIVPNSQFISQNVRNVTMGHANGVVTIALTYPLDVDPVQVREMLLQTFKDNDAILSAPAPFVRLTELSADGMVISITGYVPSPRMISVTKSDLLFTILSQLRQMGIDISVAQTVIIRDT